VTGVWRCRVCEGVNQGGRTCAACGAVVPPGEPVRAAVRARMPSAALPAPSVPAAVPPTPRRRDLRGLPTMEDLRRVPPEALLRPETRMQIIPLPSGCLMAPVPVRRRPRWY
jgi:hypothetical protein